MSREETNKIKREVMDNLAKIIPGSKVPDKKWIITPHHKIRVMASKDYKDSEIIRNNWYGLFKEDLDDKNNNLLVFTTSDPKRLLVISLENFKKNILPYLRPSKNGFFFLIRWENDRCYLPKEYIPKSLRDKINDSIDLNEYKNNLSALGTNYGDYLKQFDYKPKITVVTGTNDLTTMIKIIAEKDPTFLTKSTEEKLIIIRYNQIKYAEGLK